MNPCDVFGIAGILLLRRKFREARQFNHLRLAFRKLNGCLRLQLKMNSRWHGSHGRDADRQKFAAEHIIQQGRFAGTDAAKNANLKSVGFKPVKQQGERGAKFHQPMRGDDAFQLAQQLHFVLRLFEPLQARLQIGVTSLSRLRTEFNSATILLSICSSSLEIFP